MAAECSAHAGREGDGYGITYIADDHSSGVNERGGEATMAWTSSNVMELGYRILYKRRFMI
ncbi:hypothetical protein [Plantactinospora sp. CA-290183]|uniref:hypothetical protein n=1 Tax=Plantactinospora sp. CA-290183 TaxID=3240006 RepID=UPI003D89F0D5